MSKEKFTFFWNGVFSQWYPSPFKIMEVTYNCAEQFMMANKAILFDDRDIYDKIMKSRSPKEQKALGRQVKNFDAEKWNSIAKNIVYEGNKAKFEQNPDMYATLLATHGTTLVEASPYDCVWGIGLAENDPRANDRTQWRGTNWLGETLTNLRQDFIKQESI